MGSSKAYLNVSDADAVYDVAADAVDAADATITDGVTDAVAA